MESVEQLVKAVKNPGESYYNDLLQIYDLLKPMSADERHVVIVGIIELGYRIKDASSIATVVQFLEGSFDFKENERNEAYKDLSKKLFGG